MVSLNREEFMSLAEAAKSLPGCPHVSTLHRWRLRGIGGIKLETVRIGGRRYVSKDALERFIESTTALADGELPQPQSNRQREQAIRQAEEELEQEGI